MKPVGSRVCFLCRSSIIPASDLICPTCKSVWPWAVLIILGLVLILGWSTFMAQVALS